MYNPNSEPTKEKYIKVLNASSYFHSHSTTYINASSKYPISGNPCAYSISSILGLSSERNRSVSPSPPRTCTRWSIMDLSMARPGVTRR